MEKSLFGKIAKLSHKLTKVYRSKFTCDYRTQQAIFFKLLYNMYKAKTSKQESKNVTIKRNGVVKHMLMLVKGKGLNLEYMLIDNDKPVSSSNKWFPIWKLNNMTMIQILLS